MDNIDPKAESQMAGKPLPATPETVSSTSSTHAMFGEVGVEESKEKETDMMAGVKADLVCTVASCMHKTPCSK